MVVRCERIHLAQEKDQWSSLENMVVNVEVL
jgi:hypothetical protein